jgi:hypothetical protein
MVAKAMRALGQGGPGELLRLSRDFWSRTSPRPVPGEPGRDRNDYAEWVRRYDTLSESDTDRLRHEAGTWPSPPVISVVMPTYNPRGEWLVEAIESVRRQAYPHWQLCIADDASTDPHVREILEQFARKDSRIVVAFRAVNGHICATSNSALELATGQWICLLDHDDLLPPHALYWIARTVVQRPGVRMIYSDEDKISPSGERFGAYFKCDLNPDLLRSQNMFSHLGAFETSLVRNVGGFRPGLEGSQDYDLALRCFEKVERNQVVHVPRVLYHWRVHDQSTASSNAAKPYAQVAAERALNEHLQRTGRKGAAHATTSGYRVLFELPTPVPRVGIILGGRAKGRRRESCLAALRDTDYPDLRIYVTAAGIGAPDARFHDLAQADESAARAAAMAQLRAEGCSMVCFLDVSAKPLSPSWLREMASQCLRDEIALVGPKLVDTRGRVVSGGVCRLDDRLQDLHAGYLRASHGYGGRGQLAQTCTYLRPACIISRVEVYASLVQGGACDEGRESIELCLAARAHGLDVLWTPYAELEVDAPAAPLSSGNAVAAANDKFSEDYNPNLHCGEADFSLAWPPAVTPTGCRAVQSPHG